jgi:hypothetical protein
VPRIIYKSSVQGVEKWSQAFIEKKETVMPYGNVPPVIHMIPPEVVCEAIARGLYHRQHESNPLSRRGLENDLYYASEPTCTQSVWAIERLMRLSRPSSK